MVKITTKEKLIEILEDLRIVEITARDNYNEDISLFKDKKIKDLIIIIKNDEIRHITLFDEMLKLIK